MEEGQSILGANFDEDIEDIEMLDAEEGELLEHDASQTDVGKCGGEDVSVENQDINRFALDTCRRLREKKSYMVCTAAGSLGVSALSDLVGEVEAIQVCGGQTTADGRRNQTGGGILWNIIRAQEPVAYIEIMKKAKEFEKQFKQQKHKASTE
ncbi:hypothetical protein SLE2022_036970 [Rubroshorea leprosula]